MTTLDLFAGPGGWDVGARALGLDPVGVESDEAARLTRDAAGLLTATTGDVRDYLASVGLLVDLGDIELDGLIASPPCQTFSMAGKGSGRLALDTVLVAMADLANTGVIDYGAFDDERTGLVLEPLRYALELEPEWMVWEQVPPVRPVWEAAAVYLQADGYHVWTGVLNAADYGVPQTRKRAVLIASRTRKVGCPPPTHVKDGAGGRPLWVSMAQALGWKGGQLVGFPRRADTPSNGAGDNVVEVNGTAYRGRDLFNTDGPSQVVTGKSRSWQRFDPSEVVFVNGNQENAAVRHEDEPAPTITFGHNAASIQWQPAQLRDEVLPDGQARVNDQSGTPVDLAWTEERPSTTVATRDLVQHPGATANRTNGSTKSRNDGIRVTVAEAAVLQSFPADPWQGSKTKQYQQVGNAIPPRLAAHILAEATGISLAMDEEETHRVMEPTGLVVSTGNNSMVTGRTGSRAGDGDVRPYERSVDEPAPTVDTKAPGSWQIHEPGGRKVTPRTRLGDAA